MLSAAIAVLLQASAPAPPPLTAEIGSPLWLQVPDQARLNRLLRGVRSDLLHAGAPIEAIIQCDVRTDGLLEACFVASETPRRSGLGKGALRLMSKFRLVSSRPDGGAIAGGTVRIPLRVERKAFR